MRCHDAKVEPLGDDCAVLLCLGEDGMDFKEKAIISMTPHEAEELARELMFAAAEVECLERMRLQDEP